MKISPENQFFLLLLISVLKKGQQATTSNDRPSCNERQYWHEELGKCCSRCPPGSYMKTECRRTLDTQCQPCEEGRYTSSWNYAERCRNCGTCASFLVEKEKCSPTKKELCVCQEGYTCAQFDGLGICQLCKYTQSTVPSPSEPSVTQATTAFSPWVIPVFFISGVVILVLLLAIFYVKCNTRILEKLGCMAKVKKPLPETAGLEDIAPPLLSYPMEETDKTQSAEYVMNSAHRHPI